MEVYRRSGAIVGCSKDTVLFGYRMKAQGANDPCRDVCGGSSIMGNGGGEDKV